MTEAKKPTPNKKPKPIMDVAHPNRSAPSGNSKSVIVGHGPMMKDPMVVEVSDGAADKSEAVSDVPSTKSPALTAPILKSAGEKQIKPLEQAATSAEDVTEVVEAATPEPVVEAKEKSKTETAEAEPEPKTEAKGEKPEEVADEATEPEADSSEPDDANTDSGKPATDKSDKVEPTDPDAKTETEKAKQEADAALQKLIESKKYFLPINALEKRRSKQFVALGIFLSLILIIAWADIALDAGLLHINNIKPITHFFSS